MGEGRTRRVQKFSSTDQRLPSALVNENSASTPPPLAFQVGVCCDNAGNEIDITVSLINRSVLIEYHSF
jgi:hypothetical protein